MCGSPFHRLIAKILARSWTRIEIVDVSYCKTVLQRNVLYRNVLVIVRDHFGRRAEIGPRQNHFVLLILTFNWLIAEIFVPVLDKNRICKVESYCKTKKDRTRRMKSRN